MMNESEHSVSWMHRLGSLVAVVTFLLDLTGMLASASGSGEFTPRWRWPGAAAHPSASPPAKYAHPYTVLALAVAVLTVVFVAWLWKSRSPRYLKNLGAVTVGLLLAMAVMLLSPARHRFPAAVSLAYFCGMQAFFCLTVCLALFTRTDWRWDEPKVSDLASPSIRQILVFTTAAVFAEPFLGQSFRTMKTGIAPHLVLGIAVTVGCLWVMEMALTKFPFLRTFKISAVFLAEVVFLQLFLGIIVYSMNLDARALPGPRPGLLVMNVTHAAIGELVLAASLFLTCQGFRYFAAPGSSTWPEALSSGDTDLHRD